MWFVSNNACLFLQNKTNNKTLSTTAYRCITAIGAIQCRLRPTLLFPDKGGMSWFVIGPGLPIALRAIVIDFIRSKYAINMNDQCVVLCSEKQYIDCESEKTGPFSFEHNFCKYCPILIILSLLQTEIICPQTIIEFVTSPIVCYRITLKKCKHTELCTDTGD